MSLISSLDRGLSRRGRSQIFALATLAVIAIALCDFATGYEISFSLFYLAPVALAAWYAGRTPGVAISVLSCGGWYLADFAAGHQYTSAAIPLWNSLVRLGFFLVGAQLIAALHHTLHRERLLSTTDSLTGLLGRRAFEERLEHDLALARRQRGTITVAYVDLDNFKQVNDTYGHSEGDRVLTTAGQVLAEGTRSADSVARLGGDEFALILPDTTRAGAEQVVSNLTTALRKAFAAIDRDVSCSVGVVTFQQPPQTSAAAVALADGLMYEVKRQGKGAVAYQVVGARSDSSGVVDS